MVASIALMSRSTAVRAGRHRCAAITVLLQAAIMLGGADFVSSIVIARPAPRRTARRAAVVIVVVPAGTSTGRGNLPGEAAVFITRLLVIIRPAAGRPARGAAMVIVVIARRHRYSPITILLQAAIMLGGADFAASIVIA